MSWLKGVSVTDYEQGTGPGLPSGSGYDLGSRLRSPRMLITFRWGDAHHGATVDAPAGPDVAAEPGRKFAAQNRHDIQRAWGLCWGAAARHAACGDEGRQYDVHIPVRCAPEPKPVAKPLARCFLKPTDTTLTEMPCTPTPTMENTRHASFAASWQILRTSCSRLTETSQTSHARVANMPERGCA